MSSTGYTRSLDQLRREDESSFGGKSASLGELLAAEIPVPPGFALSTAAYTEFAADDVVAAAIAVWIIVSTLRETIGSQDELISPERMSCGHEE